MNLESLPSFGVVPLLSLQTTLMDTDFDVLKYITLLIYQHPYILKLNRGTTPKTQQRIWTLLAVLSFIMPLYNSLTQYGHTVDNSCNEDIDHDFHTVHPN